MPKVINVNNFLSNKKVGLGFSGGKDSMGALEFLYNKGKRDVTLFVVDHNTPTGEKLKSFLPKVLKLYPKVNVELFKIKDTIPKGESKENFWRDQRYRFFHSFDIPIVTGHHLDDCVETWLFTSLHGNPKVIPFSNRNVIRPFLLFRKERLGSLSPYDLFLNDDSNECLDYMRNRIRHKVIPEVLKVNPGIHKVISKKLLKKYDALNQFKV